MGVVGSSGKNLPPSPLPGIFFFSEFPFFYFYHHSLPSLQSAELMKSYLTKCIEQEIKDSKDITFIIVEYILQNLKLYGLKRDRY